MKTTKKQLRTILLVIAVVGIMALLLFLSIKDLTKDKDYYEQEIIYGGELLTMKHSVNFIPTGKQYYYYGYDENKNVVVFMAEKNFASKSKISEGLPVVITGKVKRVDTKVYNELKSVESKEYPYALSASYAVNTLAGSIAIKGIIIIVIIFVLGLMILILSRKDRQKFSKIILAIGILIFITMVYSVHILTIRM